MSFFLGGIHSQQESSDNSPIVRVSLEPSDSWQSRIRELSNSFDKTRFEMRQTRWVEIKQAVDDNIERSEKICESLVEASASAALEAIGKQILQEDSEPKRRIANALSFAELDSLTANPSFEIEVVDAPTPNRQIDQKIRQINQSRDRLETTVRKTSSKKSIGRNLKMRLKHLG